jgi:hypothetical protein
MEEQNEKIEELISEIAYIGEKLTDIGKYLRKISNWQESDEEKYGEKEDEDDDEFE